jgi:hypothetical protein
MTPEDKEWFVNFVEKNRTGLVHNLRQRYGDCVQY